MLFQLTRPVRGEPRRKNKALFAKRFQLTRPVRGEPVGLIVFVTCEYISTHSPRAGRTKFAAAGVSFEMKFQLTRPVRGEPRTDFYSLDIPDISTHSPRAGRTPARSLL